MTSDPLRLSIVIASAQPGPILRECLSALEPQDRSGVEVIVVDAGGDAVLGAVRERFGWVRIIDAPGASSLPRLRGLGMAAAGAPVIGVLDAWCLVNDRWIENVVQCHRDRPELVAGGGVDLADSERRSVRAWATYLFDYWEFVAPFADGFVDVLPGNNITYKRAALPDNEVLRSAGFWKAFTNARLKEAGHRLWASSGLVARMRRRVPLGNFVKSRYHHGRSYAAMRVDGLPWWRRATRALIAPALPLLFLGRQMRGLASRPTARLWFIACAPLLLAFHVSWAWGELCGYLLGPGRSHDAIRT